MWLSIIEGRRCNLVVIFDYFLRKEWPGSSPSGCPLVRRAPFFFRLETKIEHIEHDQQVDDDDRQPEPVRPPNKIVDLERNVNAARYSRHPLRPGQRVPQAVGFDEAQQHVDAGYDGDLPQADIVEARHQIDENSDVVMVGADVEKFEQALRHSPNASVAKGEQPEAAK